MTTTGQKHTPTHILVGGMMQSGSHLLFNLIRILLEELGCGVEMRVSGRQTGYVRAPANNSKVFVIDREHSFVHTPYYHDASRHTLDYCVFSYRDPRDTASSWSLKEDDEEKSVADLISRARLNINVFESYNYLDPSKLLRWRYEDYKRALAVERREELYELFNNLVSFLSLQDECDTGQPFDLLVDKIVSEAETEIDKSVGIVGSTKNAHWQKTGLVTTIRSANKGKVGGFRDILSPEIISAIESECGDWLKEHGYIK